MTIERTENEIIIRLSPDLDVSDIQRMLDYLSYKQTIQGSKATQDDIRLYSKIFCIE